MKNFIHRMVWPLLALLAMVSCGQEEEYEPPTVIWLEQQWEEMSPGEQTKACAGYDNVGEDAMRETMLEETGDSAEAEIYVAFWERHCGQ